jgi:hypothetical protein
MTDSIPEISAYERARNIERAEVNGMVYVYVKDFTAFNRILDYERAEADRKYRQGLYAQHAAEAWGG